MIMQSMISFHQLMISQLKRLKLIRSSSGIEILDIRNSDLITVNDVVNFDDTGTDAGGACFLLG